jgi:hypothetical protein
MAVKPAQVEQRDGRLVDIERAIAKQPAPKKPASAYYSTRDLDPVKILFETLQNPLLGVSTGRNRTAG